MKNKKTFHFGKYEYVVSVNSRKVLGYLNILEYYINNNIEEITEKKIDLPTLIKSYIEYMYTYLKYQNIIDYEEFLIDYLNRNVKKNYMTLRRQK